MFRIHLINSKENEIRIFYYNHYLQNSAINDIIQMHIKSENFTPLSNGIVVRGFCKHCKQWKQKNQTNVVHLN